MAAGATLPAGQGSCWSRAGVLMPPGRKPWSLCGLLGPTRCCPQEEGHSRRKRRHGAVGVTPKRLITGRRQHSPPWDLIGRDNPSLTLTPSGVSRCGGRPWGPAASVVSHGGLAAPADPRRQRGEPQGRGRRGGGLLSHCLSPGISSAFVWGDTSCRGGCIRLLAPLCSPKSQLLLPATLALSLSITLIHLSSGRPPSLSVNHPRGGFTGWPVAGSPALVPAGRSPCPPP